MEKEKGDGGRKRMGCRKKDARKQGGGRRRNVGQEWRKENVSAILTPSCSTKKAGRNKMNDDSNILKLEGVCNHHICRVIIQALFKCGVCKYKKGHR